MLKFNCNRCDSEIGYKEGEYEPDKFARIDG